MSMDINKLADHFAHASFRVESVHHYFVEAGLTSWQKTMPYPGFVFLLGGSAELVFDGTAYRPMPECVVHGGADMSLAMRVIGEAKCEYFLVLYEIDEPEPEGMNLRSSHFELLTGRSPRLTELLWNLWRTFHRPGAIPAFQTEMLFRCVLSEVFVCALHQTSISSQALFDSISSYIHAHYMDSLTMPRLAEQNGINKNRLAYVFYKHAGMGPGDYLLQYRLKCAKELLLSDSAPLREIAQATGFNDPFYFSKAFKKQFGVSPSEYRERFINNTW